MIYRSKCHPTFDSAVIHPTKNNERISPCPTRSNSRWTKNSTGIYQVKPNTPNFNVEQNSSFLCVQGLIPHIFVRGSCFFRLPTSCPRPARVLPAPAAPHTTHNLSPHNLSTHNLLTHNLPPHTTCSHTTCHHKTYSHTTCHHVADVALGDMDMHSPWHIGQLWHWAGSGGALGSQPWTPRLFAWQAWHLAIPTVTLRGRHGTWRHRPALCVAGVALVALGWLWWRAWFPVDAVDAAALCVAGVALGDVDLHFAWQARHLATWTCILRGRRNTCGAGLALVARLVPSWRRGRCGSLRGRRGTWRHGRAFCAAGVPLMALGWLWWRAWFPVDAVDAAALCVAGVEPGDIDLHFVVAHTTLSHTTLSHKTLSHTTLSHTALSHTALSHTIFYTQLCHIQLFHFSRTTLLHTQTYTLTQHCHTQLFHPTCLAPSPFLPAFPISFSHLLVIIGRSWFVGLSGPLIFCPPVPSAEPKDIEIWWNLGVRGLTTIQQGFDFIVHLRSGGKGEALHTSDLMAHI